MVLLIVALASVNKYPHVSTPAPVAARIQARLSEWKLKSPSGVDL